MNFNSVVLQWRDKCTGLIKEDVIQFYLSIYDWLPIKKIVFLILKDYCDCKERNVVMA